MPYRVAADLVVVCHGLFMAFVVAGGFLTWRWPHIAWAHVPAAAWGALIEFAGWICPLTPLENHFRDRAGELGYTGGFVEHYLIPAIYPGFWTVERRVFLGVTVVAVNVLAYSIYFRRRRRTPSD